MIVDSSSRADVTSTALPGAIDIRPASHFGAIVAASSLAYALFIYLMQPAGVVLMDDDFGYVRSVVDTLQFGRPWSDEWLEPWSASLSLFTALLYRIIGSFEAAIHGTLAVCAGVSLGAATALLRGRGLSTRRAVLIGVLFLTFPTLAWKSAQFTGMAVYLPCLLMALYAGEKRRWGWFLLFWSTALATRQSAVTWGLIPLFEMWQLRRSSDRSRSRDSRRLAAVIGAAAALFLLLRVGMNKTHSQLVITDRMFEHAPGATFWQTFGLGSLFFFCAAGLGTFFAGDLRVTPRDPRVRLTRTALFSLIAAPLILLDLRTRVPTDLLLLSSDLGWLYANGAVLVALAGWSSRSLLPRWNYIIAAACSLFFVAWRPHLWDYFFVDVGVLGFFSLSGITPGLRQRRDEGRSPWWKREWAALLLAGAQLVFILQIKGAIDKSYALCRLHEEAARAGRIDPSEVGKAPFGLQGWYFHRWFATHDGHLSEDIAGFHRYLRGGAIIVGKRYSPTLHILPTFQDRPPSSDSEIVAATQARHLWFYDAQYYLLRFPDRPGFSPATSLPQSFQVPRFPLNDAEWRALIESPGR